MASGFLILADGRCLACRWWAYDAVIKAVAEQLGGSDAALALREWLLSLLPGPDDEQHIGYGPWRVTPLAASAWIDHPAGNSIGLCPVLVVRTRDRPRNTPARFTL